MALTALEAVGIAAAHARGRAATPKYARSILFQEDTERINGQENDTRNTILRPKCFAIIWLRMCMQSKLPDAALDASSKARDEAADGAPFTAALYECALLISIQYRCWAVENISSRAHWYV
jgi:hypothetical protein